MRLVVDLQALETGSRYRGIGQYTVSLVREMLRQKGSHEVILLFSSFCDDAVEYAKGQLEELLDGVDIKNFHTLPGMIEMAEDNSFCIEVAESMRWDFISKLSPDAVLTTSLFEGAHEEFTCSIEPDSSILKAVIGYDLIPLISPEKYLGDERVKSWYMRKISSLKNSDLIFAISESAQGEFKQNLHIGDDKVKVISTACSEDYSLKGWDGEQSEVLKSLGVVKPFILYSGASDERKNIRGLLSAFAKLDTVLKKKYQIVLVGKYNDLEKEALVAQGEKCGIADKDLIFSGYISNYQLSILYSECDLFVFPSFHEGFGLPVLEAISCGAPTICSNTTSLPEVLDFPEAMFDPSNVDEIAACMYNALTNKEFRDRLVEHGLKQAKKFAWSDVAERAWRYLEYGIEKKKPDAFSASGDSLGMTNLKILLNDSQADDQLKRLVAECLAKNDLELNQEVLKYDKKVWRLEGPFDSSYSLALVNREMARALVRLNQDVALHSTEGPGDYDPDLEYLQYYPDIEAMYNAGKENVAPEVLCRNLYPPRAGGMSADVCFFHQYAWEESGFPWEWAQGFNINLDGLTPVSEHVKKVLIDNGVALPLPVTGNGVDHWENVHPGEYLVDGKGFKFLHVSSCFPRKGIDVLLEAFGKAFDNEDDVTLVIKTFENPHNDVVSRLDEWVKSNSKYPDVNIIFDDLSAEELKAFYRQGHALVAPSKAEGFGLPLAEALLCELPVITTAWGGQLDFCNADTAWLVDYKFSPATSHFNLPLSVWAEPDAEDLAKKMREVFDSNPSERQRRVNNAIRLLEREFRWDHVASRMLASVDKIKNFEKPGNLNIGWVSTWNQKCGIATYSEHLVEEDKTNNFFVFAPKVDELIKNDADNVVRCWHQDDKDELFDLWREVKKYDLDALVIQMNIYFYSYEHLKNFVRKVKSLGVEVVLVLHSTAHVEERKSMAELRPCLDLVDRVVVHSVDDLNRLKSAGVVSNAMILPHGILDLRPSTLFPVKKGVKTIATYGFALPNKGIEELIDAFHNIANRRDDLELLLLNAEHDNPVSAQFIEKIKEKVKLLNLTDKVRMVNDFLEDQKCIDMLAEADVIAMPYQATGESSSGAVKVAIASRSPVIVTPLSIFDDVRGAVDFFDGKDSSAIELGINKILNNERSRTTGEVEDWCSSHVYSVISKRFFKMIESLVINFNLASR